MRFACTGLQVPLVNESLIISFNIWSSYNSIDELVQHKQNGLHFDERKQLANQIYVSAHHEWVYHECPILTLSPFHTETIQTIPG